MGDWSSAKYEKELSDEIAQKRGSTRGISVPDIFWKRYNENRVRDFSKRALTSGGSTSGTQFVPTDHIGSEFISALREKDDLARTWNKNVRVFNQVHNPEG